MMGSDASRRRLDPALVGCLAIVIMTLAACGQRTDRSRLGDTPFPTRGRPGSSLPGAPGDGGTGCSGGTSGGGGVAVAGRTRFAIFGDYGSAGETEGQVAALVKGWNPDFIVTTGDNNYPIGAADTIDANIGQYYHDYISPYVGRYGCGASVNRFFPTLGNHDWDTPDALPYRNYFALPGNERYYDVVFGDVHLFAIDSDPREPDSVAADSVQATWLKNRLASQIGTWRIVTLHHPPFSSGPHQSSVYMRWPFKTWGADIVFAGHDHDYERFDIDGLPYIVNGLGGSAIYTLGPPIPGSLARFDTAFGAVLVDASPTRLSAQFFAIQGDLVDQLVLNRSP